jgi:hypothetical protein
MLGMGGQGLRGVRAIIFVRDAALACLDPARDSGAAQRLQRRHRILV